MGRLVNRLALLLGIAVMYQTGQRIDNETIVDWAPQPGPQTEALARIEKEVGVGGGRFGGKSDLGRAFLVKPTPSGLLPYEHPEYAALVIRKNHDDLSDWIERARRFYAPTGATMTGGAKSGALLRWPSGAYARTGHLADEKAYEKYQGHEYQRMLIEETEQIPRFSDYQKLLGSCRNTKIDGMPAQCMTNFNPGGIGHVWLKQHFVDHCFNTPYHDTTTGEWRIFVQVLAKHNAIGCKKDPAYIAYLNGLEPKLRAAWRDGNWDVFSGQFFDSWDPRVHIVDPFELPREWHRYRGLDWGHTAPAAVVWVAVDYEGNHWQYREYYQGGKEPYRLAHTILEMTPRAEHVLTTLASPDIWARNQYGRGPNYEQFTTESIQQLLEAAGLYVQMANNDRKSGWAKMRDLLAHDANRPPKYRVFRSCPETCRTIPALIHDEKNVEDIPKSAEDHIAEAIRYLVMHTAQSVMPESPKPFTQRYLEEMMIQQGQSPGGSVPGWGNQL